MAPQATTGETLADRSQRILGLALDEQSDSEQGSKSRKSNVSPSRRREQVAQAQRKHRQRTQKYIRELENEVIRLRGSENGLTVKIEALLAQLDLFRDALAVNGIPVPGASSEFRSPAAESLSRQNFGSEYATSHNSGINVDLSGLSQVDAEPACLLQAAEGSPLTFESPTVNIDLTELSQVEPQRACCIQAAEGPPHVFESATLGDMPWMPPVVESKVPPTTSHTQSTISANRSLFNAQSAIDFILRLERACLPHLKFAYLNHVNTAEVGDPPYHSGPSHAFNTSTTLFYDHLAQKPASQPFRVSASEVDRLLNASSYLNLEDEYTPVQVWSIICNLAKTHKITYGTLQVLAEECSKYTYCNSFGSVIDKSIVAAIFQHVFASPEVPSIYQSPISNDPMVAF